MQLTTRIFEATSTDESRPTLTYVYCLNGAAYATNSYIAAKVPVEGVNGTPTWIPRDAAKAAVTGPGAPHELELGEETVTVVNARKGTRQTFDTRHASGSTFPKLDELMGPALTHEAEARSISFGVNPALLTELARALGADPKHPGARVTVLLNEEGEPFGRPLIVRPLGGDADAVGIAMPVRLPEAN